MTINSKIVHKKQKKEAENRQTTITTTAMNE